MRLHLRVERAGRESTNSLMFFRVAEDAGNRVFSSRTVRRHDRRGKEIALRFHIRRRPSTTSRKESRSADRGRSTLMVFAVSALPHCQVWDPRRGLRDEY